MSAPTKLSESKLKSAFSARNWPELRAYLDSTALDELLLQDLLGHLRRFSGFILRYPNTQRELSRDTFLHNLRQYVLNSLGAAASEHVANEIGLLLRVERGYRSLLRTLNDAEISRLPAALRVAACLNWALVVYAKVTERHRKSVRRAKDFTLQSHLTIDDDDGNPVPVDTAINAIVRATSTTLVMESYRNGWHSADGTVIVPQLPRVSEDDVIKAVDNAHIAMCWSRWQRTEERRRFLGGSLREFFAPALPAWAPNDATEATEYSPGEDEFFDFAANERVMDRLGQQFFEMLVETDLKRRISSIDNNVPLVPAGFVSLAEAHAASALGDVLKYEITDDIERPGGLRILEWLRGYAVIQELATNVRAANPRSVASLATIIRRTELITILKRCGLSDASSALFIDSVTFKTSSDDLFDSPLIAKSDGDLQIFGPAVLTANLSVVVLSNLATLKQPLSRKGRALEAATLSLLSQRNLHARGFKVTRDRQEYEYDVVLSWDDYVFVFECKNRSLSGNQPISAYHFDLGIRSSIQQVRRLADALRRYPDILTNEMQVDVSDKHIIPVVLNSLPYARIGTIDGVYCTDSSILDRFFSHRYFFVKVPYKIRENATILHRVALASLWSGKTPTPTDLLKQLNEPAQLKLLKGHTQQIPTTFQISGTHAVSAVDYTRVPWTIESVSDVFGVPAEDVKRTMNVVRTMIRKTKRKASKKRRRSKRK